MQVDYIVVGGGLTGCVVASRLSRCPGSPSVVLLEAGPDASENPNVTTPQGSYLLIGTDLDWMYKTKPDPNTSDRVHSLVAGKALGGGSLLNFGSWSRGDKADYDDWANAVGDERWSFQGQLPYMKKTEHLFSSPSNESGEQYGKSGPIHIAPVSANPARVYGLREPLLQAWAEKGVNTASQTSSGFSQGVSESIENWNDGRRQPAHQTYDLSQVRVITESKVEKVNFDGHRASGVILVDGQQYTAKKEIILAAGAMATPQILMLSGLGPSEVLESHNITTIVDLPEVGKNLIDHFALFQYWKLLSPEQPLALGNPKWTDPAYAKGSPSDWIANQSVPTTLLEPALRNDQAQGKCDPSQVQALQSPNRSHLETLVIYAPLLAPFPPDGSLVTTSIMLNLPTSRGKVTLASSNAEDKPLIQPNYFDTASDQVSLIYGARLAAEVLLTTSAAKPYLESEVPPPGFSALSETSSDAEFEDRIRKTGLAHQHSVGTAAMGKVVDSRLKVRGVEGLRIVDASVVPVPIGGHPQATLFALAEQAADILIQDA